MTRAVLGDAGMPGILPGVLGRAAATVSPSVYQAGFLIVYAA
jgi:hypothetical protein